MNGKLAFDIEPLDSAGNDRAAFVCGNEALDRYLQQQASQDVKRRVAAAFIATRPGQRQVLGYYTLSQASVEVASIGILVDAIDDDAIRFYERFGFLQFPESQHRLFLPMHTIQEAQHRQRLL